MNQDAKSKTMQNLVSVAAVSEPTQLHAATRGDAPIPLVLGTTGHRDIREKDREALEQQVRRVIKSLQSEYPHTPLKLLSPLAAGADRLVVGVALQEGVGLIVPLCWPPDLCPEELHRTGSREESDRLLARAEQTIELPLLPGITADDICHSETARDQQYEQVGAYVARHSKLLIALWDGIERSDSGTSRVILWQRRGDLAPHAPRIGRLDEVENGPVYHITTPRAAHSSPVEQIELVVRYPDDYAGDAEAEQAFRQMWRRIDEFNQIATQRSNRFQKQLAISRDWVFPQVEREQVSAPLVGLLDRYARADAASLAYQGEARWTLVGLFGLAVIALVCFEIYSHLLMDWWPLLLTYLTLLCLSLVWYGWSRRRRQQARYLDYRALAEAMRVQFFWRLGGVKESVVDYYLRNLRSELDWIRQAMRAANLVTGGHQPAEQLSRDEWLERLRLVRKHWVADQSRFFAKKAPANARQHHRWSRASAACFWLAIGLAAVLLAVHLRTHHMNHVLVVCVFLSAAAAALCHEYAEKEAFSVLAKRYDWMRSFYSSAQRHLDELLAAGDVEQAQQLLLELGREALHENAEWLLQRRQRPIKPVSA